MKQIKPISLLSLSCSFHAGGPEWPQETQHTGLQEVLVFLTMVQSLFFLHPLSSRTFPPSALCQPESQPCWPVLAQNAELVSKLRTIATPVSFFIISNWLRRKEPGFQGAQTLPSLGSCVFQLTKSSCVHCLCGWDRCKLSSQFADIWCWGTNCCHSPQDKTDCSLKHKPCFLYYCYLYDFGGKCERADVFFLKFVLEDSYCRSNEMVTLDTHFMGEFWKPNAM